MPPSARHVLTALVFLPALYLDFSIYQTGNYVIALAFLVVLAFGAYVYLHPCAYTFRYLFPGLLGFGLFVIFPLLYTVYIGFTRYSSDHLLAYDRALDNLRSETFLNGEGAYAYQLFAQADGRQILTIRDVKDPSRRFVSGPLEMRPGTTAPPAERPIPLQTIDPDGAVPGRGLELGQVTRSGLFMALRGRPFALPDGSVVSLDGLSRFTARERLYTANPDGTLTNKQDGSTVHADRRQGLFVDERGKRVGVGFRTFNGLENYVRILSDPRIQGPFVRIFLWTVAFSALSVLGSFAVGIVLAVLLEWQALGFRKAYRTLLILPYAVPAILSILIFKGLFDQEFGAVNALFRTAFGFAPEWETNPWGARLMVLIVNVWLGYPYMMLVATGMLQSIPSTIYEASAIDGGTPATNFFRITLPLILPPLFPILISSFAFNFNNFNLVFLLTGGGPKMVGGGTAGQTDLLVTYTFNLAFRDSGANYGLASAIATLLFLLVGSLAWLNLRLGGQKVKT